MPQKEESFFKETFRFALITLVIVLPIRFFIAEPFVVSGASMEPTFQSGDYLIVDQISYRFEAPKRGEVIVFRYPNDTKKFFIKRIIGLPGESISISSGVITITPKDSTKSIVLREPYAVSDIRETFRNRMLKDDEYFVMGDNRDASSDSRRWGPLGEKYVVGRALLRLFPLEDIGIFPGIGAPEENPSYTP